MMYMMEGPVEPRGVKFSKRFEAYAEDASKPYHFLSSVAATTCSKCVDPDAEHGSVQSYPCGGDTVGSSILSKAEGGDDVPGLWLFHYGANMGCHKLGAIGVKPQSAQAAFVPGWCLRFGTAEGVPTTSKEPGYGNLVPCEDGCVHGVLHKISKSELSKIDDTEPGYELTELPQVTGYSGQHYAGVRAYTMQKGFTPHAPSRRYGGLLYCTAKAELAPAYAEQLGCELDHQGIEDLTCREKFLPLAAQEKQSDRSGGLPSAMLSPLIWGSCAIFMIR